jgi:cytoskeletal protein CcmA (bactofilin family)
MYADGALPVREAQMLELHAQMCAACAARIDTLRAEGAVLRSALRFADDPDPVPRFMRPPRTRDFVVLIASVLLIGGFSKAFWSTVASAIPSELGWLNPLISGALYDRAVAFMTFVILEGAAMWTAALNFVGTALVIAFGAWLAFSAVRHRAFAGIAAAALAATVALPSIGHAFEMRRSEGLVAVAADETVDDTLFAMGNLVTIDGTVNGDLLAFGEEVTVRGNVTGNLITAARLIRIEGTVGGSVLGAGQDLALANGRVGRDFYAFANSFEIAPEAGVIGNAIGFAQSVDVDGRVGSDLRGFANTITVSGAVDGNVDGYGASIRLLPTARVNGNVTAHVETVGDLEVATGAVVGGNVDEQIAEERERRNEYLTFGYYFGQIVRLAGAFVTGLLLLWLFPVLREVSLPNATAVLSSGAIGLAAAVTLPVAAFIVCLTVVGIPLGLLTFLVGAIGLYFAKAVIAQIIGRAVLRDRATPPHFAMTLLVGLAIVIVAINLPWVGGIANLVMTLVGFGIIVSLVLARLNRGTAV